MMDLLDLQVRSAPLRLSLVESVKLGRSTADSDCSLRESGALVMA